MTMKKVIFTGATGTIGYALIDELLRQGTETFVLCRPNSQGLKLLPKDKLLHVLQIDLSELARAKDLLPKDCDVFYHFGWQGTYGPTRDSVALQESNIKHTLDAVNLAHDCGCSTFIGAGSQAQYGRFEGTLRVSTPCFPETPYGAAKLCAEQLSRIEAHNLGMKHIWTRIVSIYGPYDDPQTMIMSSIQKFLQREKASFTKGEQLWDYLYSGDAARAFLLLGEKGVDGKVYVIGSGVARPLKEYITILRDAIDKNLPVGFGEVPYGKNQVMHLCADISELARDTGWKPQVGFEEGIQRTIEFVKSVTQGKRRNITQG